ncbi:MAG: hypothetical protein ACD_46C00221G0016 [uncultured bacterium]|nr:MAG: hypothetical protein ACD_46C00221G0016 [uncultured bacterium]
MQLSIEKREELFRKLARIFTDLNQSEVGKKATENAASFQDEDFKHISEITSKGCFNAYWSSERCYYLSELCTAWTSQEVINGAKNMIEKVRRLLNENENNVDIKDAVKKINDLGVAYQESDKDLKQLDLIQELKKIRLTQDDMVKTLKKLSATQEEIKKELDNKANKSDIPHPPHAAISALSNKLNTIASSITDLSNTVLDLKNNLPNKVQENEKSSFHLFGKKNNSKN